MREERVCIDCGKSLADAAPRTKRCQACRRKNAAIKEKQNRLKKTQENLQKDQVCEKCGAVFHAKGPAHFCQKCRTAIRTAAMRRKGAPKIEDQIDTAQIVQKENGVIMLKGSGSHAPWHPRKPTPPPKGTVPGSLPDVDYKLNLLNYERDQQGLPPISYGMYVSQYLK